LYGKKSLPRFTARGKQYQPYILFPSPRGFRWGQFLLLWHLRFSPGPFSFSAGAINAMERPAPMTNAILSMTNGTSAIAKRIVLMMDTTLLMTGRILSMVKTIVAMTDRTLLMTERTLLMAKTIVSMTERTSSMIETRQLEA